MRHQDQKLGSSPTTAATIPAASTPPRSQRRPKAVYTLYATLPQHVEEPCAKVDDSGDAKMSDRPPLTEHDKEAEGGPLSV
jgi:hypothetical protein